VARLKGHVSPLFFCSIVGRVLVLI
jgi:hypothetical protein